MSHPDFQDQCYRDFKTCQDTLPHVNTYLVLVETCCCYKAIKVFSSGCKAFFSVAFSCSLVVFPVVFSSRVSSRVSSRILLQVSPVIII